MVVLLLIVTMFGCTPPAATIIGLVFAPVSSNVTLSLFANGRRSCLYLRLLKLSAPVSQVPLAAPLQTRAFGPPVMVMITRVARPALPPSWIVLVSSAKWYVNVGEPLRLLELGSETV